jgi:hypothetical protein
MPLKRPPGGRLMVSVEDFNLWIEEQDRKKARVRNVTAMKAREGKYLKQIEGRRAAARMTAGKNKFSPKENFLGR